MSFPPAIHHVTITTFVEEHENQADEERFFTLKPEHLLLKLDHAIAASSSMIVETHEGHQDDPEHLQQHLEEENLGASSRAMQGYLLGLKGEKLMVFPKNSASLEKISVQDLLIAAGLVDGLDTPSWRRANYSLRRVGAVLHVTITYRNSHLNWFGTNQIEV
jgi:hypothetical protein